MYLPDGNIRLSTRGVVYIPNKKGIECYVDDNITGSWSQEDSDDAENVISCLEYVITYAGCTVLWCSKLQM